ncbi:MAG: ATP-binding protein [bacterium]|nr:ATP-binding protein [bacterium]
MLIKKFSLRYRIIASMVLAMTIPIAISSWISMNEHRELMIAQHKRYQQSLIQLALNSVMLFMDTNHPTEIHNSLTGLRDETHIKSIRVISNEGIIRYSSSHHEIGSAVPDSLWRRLSKKPIDMKTQDVIDFTNQTMTLVMRIPKEQRCLACHDEQSLNLGYISIVDDISNINTELNIHLREYLVLSTGIILTVVLTIFGIHLRFVQRNIKHMGGAISKVERGDFRSHIPVDDSEEIGTLARSFNGMIDRLNVMREELRIAHLKELERADKLASVGQLAASMAHEIKNPVAGISSAMQVLIEDPDQDQQNVQIFEEIARQVTRIDHAVNSLLYFARPSEPRMSFTSVDTLLEFSMKLILQQARQANVVVKQHVDENIPELYVDPGQIEQVLVNLSINGIQAMPSGGTLTISVTYQKESDKIFFRINDTGEGIPPEKLKEIFKPFYTSKHKGTGLGLSICTGIITRHGGELFVDSVVGAGSTFSFVLPRASLASQSKL